MTYTKGTRVTYKPTGEQGIIKRDKEIGNPLVFVVFDCNNDWDLYEDYTGQACVKHDLVFGW